MVEYRAKQLKLHLIEDRGWTEMTITKYIPATHDFNYYDLRIDGMIFSERTAEFVEKFEEQQIIKILSN